MQQNNILVMQSSDTDVTFYTVVKSNNYNDCQNGNTCNWQSLYTYNY